MINDYHEIVAESLFLRILNSKNVKEFKSVESRLLLISQANKFATATSNIEEDLNKYLEYNDIAFDKYTPKNTSKMFMEIASTKEPILTEPLYSYLLKILTEQLNVKQDFWETAKLVSALDTLTSCNRNIQYEPIFFKSTLKRISNSEQQKIITSLVRILLQVDYDSEIFLNLFRPDNDI